MANNNLKQIDPIIIEISKDIFQNIIGNNISDLEIFKNRIITFILIRIQEQKIPVDSKYINYIFNNNFFLQTIAFIIMINLNNLILIKAFNKKNKVESQKIYLDITDKIIEIFWSAKKNLLIFVKNIKEKLNTINNKKKFLNNLLSNTNFLKGVSNEIISTSNQKININESIKEEIKNINITLNLIELLKDIEEFKLFYPLFNKNLSFYLNYNKNTNKLENINLNLNNIKNNKLTALQIAIYYKASINIIKSIIKEYPKQLTVKDEKGFLPFHYALEHPDNFEVIKLITKSTKKNNLLEKNDNLDTILHYAVKYYNTYKNNELIINHLIELYKYSFNKEDGKNLTPVHYAIIKGLPNDIIIKLLNNHYIGFDNKNNSILNYAIQFSDLDLIKSITKNDLYKNLIKFQNKYKQLPIHIAILYNRDLSVIEYLINIYEEGLYVEDYFGLLPIHSTAMTVINKDNYEDNKKNLINIITKILEIDPKLSNRKTSSGKYPYQLAIQEKKPKEIIDILIKGTGRINVYDWVFGRKNNSITKK